MGDIWLPGFERIAGTRPGARPRIEDAPPRAVLHTDEVAGSTAATRTMARRHTWPPQLWVKPMEWKGQLIPLNRTGYALKAVRGTETNHMGRCIQVEIAGRAAETHTWPDEWLRWIAEEVVRPIHEHGGVPLVTHRPVGEPSRSGYGTAAACRMSIDRWRRFSGFCTHQNVPGNDHWDAGRLDLGRIIELVGRGGDEDMPTPYMLVWSAGDDGDLTTWVTDLVTRLKVATRTHADLLVFFGRADVVRGDTDAGRFIGLKPGEWVPHNLPAEQLGAIPLS